MIQRLRHLLGDERAAAAAELAMVFPLMFALLFGSVELGNYFLNQHAVSKAVRDGARYASRMTLSNPYDCTDGGVNASGVFEDANPSNKILNVTRTGSVDGTKAGRFPAAFWSDACAGSTALQATIRCVPKGDYEGIYTGLDGDIPVVKVAAVVKYPSVLGVLGLKVSGLCLSADSEVAVAGL